MKVSRIQVTRLYNLGSYEHISYSISVDLDKEDSAQKAMLGLERVLKGLAPECKCSVSSVSTLSCEKRRIEEMRKLLREQGSEEFRHRQGHFEGTPREYIARCEASYDESCKRRIAYEKRNKKARELLDQLGGASKWKDAKLDWEDNDY